MTQLLAVLTPIALLNTLWILPTGVAGVAAGLGARKPILTASAFIAGRFLPQFIFGLLIAIGFDTALDRIEVLAQDLWRDPDTPVVVLQLIIGVLMGAFGYRLSHASQQRPGEASSTLITPVRAFSVSTGLTILGLPSALMYFAAIDQILRADLTVAGITKALLFYNLVFVLPFASIVLARGLIGTRIDPLFGAVARFCDHWGKRLLFVGLLGLGVVLAVDAIGWFLGLPLLPGYDR